MNDGEDPRPEGGATAGEVSRRTLLAAGAALAATPLPALAALDRGAKGERAPGKKIMEPKVEPKLVRVPTEADIAKALKTAPKGISEATHRAHLTLWQGYANKTNEIRTKLAAFDFDPTKGNQIYSEIRALKVNYAFALGGYLNHNVYFATIGGEGGTPTGDLATEIDRAFGSFESFVKEWKTTAMGARGWAYLAWSGEENILEILIGDSQDTFPSWNHHLVAAIDVYEHAYFLDFQTARAKYLDAYFNAVDWNAVGEHLAKAKSARAA